MLKVVDKSQKEKTPHLALCHESQGGSANLRHASLLMKNADDIEVTEEIEKALKLLGIDKAAFHNSLRSKLSRAVQEKFGEDDSYIWVEDFNDTVVIFCTDKGLFSSNYSEANGAVNLDDLASPVISSISYESVDGKMLLSEDAEEKLEEGVYSLMTKCLSNPTTQEHIIKVFEYKQQEVLLLEQEIIKAVGEAEAVLKAVIADKEVALEKALASIAQFEQEKQDSVLKARQASIAGVEKDEAKAAELLKSLQNVPQEAFDAVVKALKDKDALLEESDLFVEKGANGEAEEETQVNGVEALIKAKYKV